MRFFFHFLHAESIWVLCMHSCTWFNVTAHRSNPHFTFETETRTDNVKKKSQPLHTANYTHLSTVVTWSTLRQSTQSTQTPFSYCHVVEKNSFQDVPSRHLIMFHGKRSEEKTYGTCPVYFISATFVWFTTTSLRRNLNQLIRVQLISFGMILMTSYMLSHVFINQPYQWRYLL